MNFVQKRYFANIYKYATCILFLIIMTACERVDECGRPVAYLSSPIYDDCKRIPLIFPYEIIDSYANIELIRWDGRKSGVREVLPGAQLSYILSFAQTNDYVFGQRDTGWVRPTGELEYFVFSLEQTNVVRFSDQKDFSCYCARFGGDVKQMQPFLKQWKTYWSQYDKQKQ